MNQTLTASDAVVWLGRGTSGRNSVPRGYASFATFGVADGDGWLVQAITVRLPGRAHEKLTGAPDANWQDRYAAYICVEQAGEELLL